MKRSSLGKLALASTLLTVLLSGCNTGVPATAPTTSNPSPSAPSNSTGLTAIFVDPTIPGASLAAEQTSKDATASWNLRVSKSGVVGLWATTITPVTTSEYHFQAQGVAGAAIRVNGNLLPVGQSIKLEAGKPYWVQISVTDVPQTGTLSLHWAASGQTFSPVPAQLTSQRWTKPLSAQVLPINVAVNDNPTFDTDLSGWYLYPDANVPNGIIRVQPGFNSTGAVQLKGNKDSTNQIAQHVFNLVPEAMYRVQVSMKADGPAICRVGGSGNSGATTFKIERTFNGPTAYQTFTTDFKLVYGDMQAMIFVYNLNKGSGRTDLTGSCYFDDVKFIRLTDAQPAPPPQQPAQDFIINGEANPLTTNTSLPASWTVSPIGAVLTKWDDYTKTPPVPDYKFSTVAGQQAWYKQVIPASKLRPNTTYALTAEMRAPIGSTLNTVKVINSAGFPLVTLNPTASTLRVVGKTFTTGATVSDVTVQIDAAYTGEIDKVKFGPLVAYGDELPPTPPDMTYGSPIALEYPVFTGDDTAYFDIYKLGDDAYTGRNFRWNFGDGTTATGDAVKHEYKNPGSYTVTLNYENAQGVTKEYKTQVASINVARLTSTPAVSNSMTVNFDAGEPIPGLTYEYKFEDSATPVNGSRVSHTYQKIGTYDYTLTVWDNRANLAAQGMRSGALQAQATTAPRKIFERTSWNTIWRRPPTANIVWTGSDQPNIPLATIPAQQTSTTLTFKADTSRDDIRNQGTGALTYEWNFNDGTPVVTSATVQRTFTETRPYLITLKVTNQFGLTDTKQMFFHVRDVRYNTLLRARWQNGTITTASVNDLDPNGHYISAEKFAGTGKLNAQSLRPQTLTPTDIFSDGTFPFVLPSRHNFYSGYHQPRSELGANVLSFCNQYKLFVNGGERFPTLQLSDVNDPTFCKAMVMMPGNVGMMLGQAGTKVVDVADSRGENRTFIKVFDHLVVPHLNVTVRGCLKRLG